MPARLQRLRHVRHEPRLRVRRRLGGAIVNAPDTASRSTADADAGRPPLWRAAAHRRAGLLRARGAAAPAHARTLRLVRVALPHAHPVLCGAGEVLPLWSTRPTTRGQRDLGHQDGFNLLRRQRQTVTVNATDLTAGTYYVGVQHLGPTSTASGTGDWWQYTLYANSAASGTVLHCRARRRRHRARDDGEPVFARARRCDYNTGVCDCPAERLPRTARPPHRAVPGAAATTTRSSSTRRTTACTSARTTSRAQPARRARARQRRQPPAAAASSSSGASRACHLFDFDDDEHDLVANFRGQSTTRCSSRRGARARRAPASGSSCSTRAARPMVCTYHRRARRERRVPCPALNGLECCMKGRLPAGATATRSCSTTARPTACTTCATWTTRRGRARDSPPIAVDDWAFWSFAVGCEGREVEVHFETVDDVSAPP